MRRLPQRDLVMRQENLQWKRSIKYLGLHFEQRSTFKIHTENTLIKLDKMVNTKNPFFNRKSKLHLKNKLVIYKAFFRPIITYAAPAWKGIALYHHKTLQVKQNKILQIIINVHSWFNTRELQRLQI